jgi:hypothetical protein
MTRAFEEHRFPTRDIVRAVDETTCPKCGAGGNCHEVAWAPGLLARRCRMCGTAAYLFVTRQARGSQGAHRLTVTDQPAGQRQLLKNCANCREDYLGYRTRFCPKCTLLKNRRGRRRL